MTRDYSDPETLRELYYEEKLSLSDIADRLGCAPITIRRYMNEYGLPRRSMSRATELFHGKVGAPYVTKDGYEEWRLTHHQDEYRVRIHRLAAVAWFGWSEVVQNDVHHKNGIPFDNREVNLEPLDRSEHIRLHANEKPRDEEGNFV